MDIRVKLEREVDAHRRKIVELGEELHHFETLALRIARVPWQLIHHTVLLRVALRGRRAAEEIACERLALRNAAR